MDIFNNIKNIPATCIILASTMIITNYILPIYIPPKQKHHIKPIKALIWPIAMLLTLQLSNVNTLPYLFNPFQLKLHIWVGLYIMKAIGLGILESIVLFFIRNTKKLKYRENNKRAKGLETLQIIDYLFLFANSFVETTFVHHLCVFVLNDKYIIKSMDEMNIINTFLSFYLLFLADDFFYAISHRFMHWGPIYPWIHKHHHRQPLPERGYLDAGNEHPLEQLIGLGCVFLAIRLISYVTTIHIVSMFIYFNIYALLAILNHTPYDVKFYGFGFEYSVAAHEMHHRNPKSNYAQYFMYWDVLMGTYKPYDDGARYNKKSNNNNNNNKMMEKVNNIKKKKKTRSSSTKSNQSKKK